MARGKIQIKRIENVTNWQVTYSKRRNGLFKKANELTVLCDAKVSLLMVSYSGKLQEFISSGITTKQVYDEYQKSLGIDLWKSHYEKMQETLKKLKETNTNLRRQISIRCSPLSTYETKKKKVRSLEETNRRLYEYDAAAEDPRYGLVEDIIMILSLATQQMKTLLMYFLSGFNNIMLIFTMEKEVQISRPTPCFDQVSS